MRSEYEQEIRNLKILLFAAVRSSGGRLVIYDSDIVRVSDEDELHRFNDSANHFVVFTSNANLTGKQKPEKEVSNV